MIVTQTMAINVN